MWEHPSSFTDIHLWLGGMHLLMRYYKMYWDINEWQWYSRHIKRGIGWGTQNAHCQKYPHTQCDVSSKPYRIFMEHNLTSMAELQILYLDQKSGKSRTAKLWVNWLITPAYLIVLQYIRAERESDWPLHIATVREMMPMLFAAFRVNYARYGLYYLRNMDEIPEDVRVHFVKGEQTIHHRNL